MGGKKLPSEVQKERNQREQKYITVYDIYTPNFRRRAPTSKFYSKYEGDASDVNQKLLKELQWALDVQLKDKISWSETENQMYGWFTKPIVELDRNDPRFYFPRVYTEMTKTGLQLLLENRKTRKK